MHQKLTIGILLVLLAGCAGASRSQGDQASQPTGDAPPDAVAGEVDNDDRRPGDFDSASGEEVDMERARSGKPPARVSDILKGRVSGVRVTEGPNGVVIRIRGAAGDPLYMIDGVPVTPRPGGGIPFLNPYDIESIHVLKGAFATAQYGSRGANGVIVIKTKI